MPAREFLIAVSVALLASHASANGYNDEAAWQAAAGAFQQEDFEGFPNLTTVTRLPAVDIYMNRLNTLTDAPTVMAKSTTGGFSTSGSNVLVNQSQPVLPGLGPMRLFSTKPGQHIKGIGYWNTGGDDSTVIRVYGPGGALIETYDTGNASLVFAGVLTSAVVAYVEIDAGVGNGYFTLDDLQVAFAPTPDGVTMPLPVAFWNAPLNTYAAQSSTECSSSTCEVELFAAPGSIGVAHAVQGELPSPLGSFGPIASNPQSLSLGLVVADASGLASLVIHEQQLNPGYAKVSVVPPQTWTVQVLWMDPAQPGGSLIPGYPFALSFE